MAIEERAKDYSYKVHYGNSLFDNHIRGFERRIYLDAAKEQRYFTLKAFDNWLCNNSWITRDEGNRQTLAELRNIIKNI